MSPRSCIPNSMCLVRHVTLDGGQLVNLFDGDWLPPNAVAVPNINMSLLQTMVEQEHDMNLTLTSSVGGKMPSWTICATLECLASTCRRQVLSPDTSPICDNWLIRQAFRFPADLIKVPHDILDGYGPPLSKTEWLRPNQTGTEITRSGQPWPNEYPTAEGIVGPEASVACV